MAIHQDDEISWFTIGKAMLDAIDKATVKLVFIEPVLLPTLFPQWAIAITASRNKLS